MPRFTKAGCLISLERVYVNFGGKEEDRTPDQGIMIPLLYR